MDELLTEPLVRLAIAVGIGLLVGVERERRLGREQRSGAAGLRTFALTALLGGVAEQVGGETILAVGFAFVAVAAVASYVRKGAEHTGLTTEIALLVTFLLGALAQRDPSAAAGLAVLVTTLLVMQASMHRFVGQVLAEQEVHDGLLLLASALVVLPLVPDRTVGPLDVLNPFNIWRLVVLLMAVSSAGYVAVRLVGPRFGLPIAGLAGGFVSSTATIGPPPRILRSAMTRPNHCQWSPTARYATPAGPRRPTRRGSATRSTMPHDSASASARLAAR